MSDVRIGAANALQAALGSGSPQSLAQTILQQHSRGGLRDVGAIETTLGTLAQQNPALAAQVRQEINAGLTPVERGQLAAANDGATRAATPGPSKAELGLDITQMALDIVGIFEPTPFADGSNAVISVGRGIYEGVTGGGWSAFGGRMVDAGLSAVGVVPYLGDAAKLGKLGRWAETVTKAVTLAAKDPGFLKSIAPDLKKISDAIGKAPLDSLPASAREKLLGIKKQIDDLIGAGAKKADDAAAAGVRLSGSTLVIDGAKGQAVPGLSGVKIGDAPATSTQTGTRYAKDVDGNDVRLRKPATYDSAAPQPDGGMIYTKDGTSVRYDRNGFPVFDAKADVMLDASHVKTKSDSGHFKAANELVGNALRADPSLGKKLGLTDTQIAHLTKQPPSAKPPEGLTWHHHQDTGRMQLVDRNIHDHFSGGHTGGMKLWGGGRN